MIKASIKDKNGTKVVILGLSEGNIRHLKNGRLIPIDLTPFGLAGEVLIVYGKTEQDIVAELAQVVDFPPVSKNQA